MPGIAGFITYVLKLLVEPLTPYQPTSLTSNSMFLLFTTSQFLILSSGHLGTPHSPKRAHGGYTLGLGEQISRAQELQPGNESSCQPAVLVARKPLPGPGTVTTTLWGAFTVGVHTDCSSAATCTSHPQQALPGPVPRLLSTNSLLP